MVECQTFRPRIAHADGFTNRADMKGERYENAFKDFGRLNIAGVAFVDGMIPSPAIAEATAPGMYQVKFYNIVFRENGGSVPVVETHSTITFEVVPTP